MLNQDFEEQDDSGSEDEGEELTKKANFTTVDFESFNAWRLKFNAEMNAKKRMDPKWLAQQALKQRKSGKDYFSDQAKDFGFYLDEEKPVGVDDDAVVRFPIPF